MGAAAAPLVKIARAADSRGKFRRHASIAFPESPDSVSVLAVPLRPQGGKVADLVTAFTQIPRLSDQLDLAEHGILMDDVEERAQLIDFVELARQGAGKIEAKSVD